MQDKTVMEVCKAVVAVSAVAGVVIIVSVCVMNGIDGTLAFFGVATAAGVGGYKVKNIKDFLKTI